MHLAECQKFRVIRNMQSNNCLFPFSAIFTLYLLASYFLYKNIQKKLGDKRGNSQIGSAIRYLNKFSILYKIIQKNIKTLLFVKSIRWNDILIILKFPESKEFRMLNCMQKFIYRDAHSFKYKSIFSAIYYIFFPSL